MHNNFATAYIFQQAVNHLQMDTNGSKKYHSNKIQTIIHYKYYLQPDNLCISCIYTMWNVKILHYVGIVVNANTKEIDWWKHGSPVLNPSL